MNSNNKSSFSSHKALDNFVHISGTTGMSGYTPTQYVTPFVSGNVYPAGHAPFNINAQIHNTPSKPFERK